jgi:hypothetical protein
MYIHLHGNYTLRPWRWRQHVFPKLRQHHPYPYGVNPRKELTFVVEIIQWYTWRVSLRCLYFTQWYRLEPFCEELDLDLNLWTVGRKILWTVSSPNILESVGAERHHHGLHAMFWLSSVGQVKQHVVVALRDLTCPSVPNLTFSGLPPFPADDLLAHRQYIYIFNQLTSVAEKLRSKGWFMSFPVPLFIHCIQLISYIYILI